MHDGKGNGMADMYHRRQNDQAEEHNMLFLSVHNNPEAKRRVDVWSS